MSVRRLANFLPRVLAVGLLGAAWTTPAFAQFKFKEDQDKPKAKKLGEEEQPTAPPTEGEPIVPGGVRLGEAKTQRYQVGVIVTADSGPCKGIVATLPVPIDWPEQQVKVIEEDKSTFVHNFSYRKIDGTVEQLVVSVPTLPAGNEAKVLLTVEITRHALEEPEDTSIFVMPSKLTRQLKQYLGPSPKIESTNPKIKKLAKETLEGKETAWEKAEALYDVTREKVKYVDGPLKGAIAALNDGSGDCEELTSLFIALCRASGIPARTVWVPGHCYPEFYLEDAEGRGHWIPCQAAGTRAFGSMPEHRPILQKGDNFRVPEHPRERKRYVSEFLTGAGGKPKVKFVRELLGEE